MLLRALLFDLDGTLLDTAPEFEKAVQKLAARRNLPTPSPSAIRARVSEGARALVQLVLGQGEQEPGLEEAREEFLQLYGDELGRYSTPFPGIPALLKKLEKHDLAWGVITNKPVRFAEPLLAQMKLAPQVLRCPEHVQKSKPSPEALLSACSELRCLPAQVLCIGDHRRDIQAGRSAGAITAAALWGYLGPEEAPTDWGADYQMENPESLTELVSELMPRAP